MHVCISPFSSRKPPPSYFVSSSSFNGISSSFRPQSEGIAAILLCSSEQGSSHWSELRIRWHRIRRPHCPKIGNSSPSFFEFSFENDNIHIFFYNILKTQCFSYRIQLVPPMSTQLEHFKEYKKRLETIVGKKQATSIISKSLIVVCSGSNDVDAYFDGILRKVQYDIPAYADFLTASASNFTQVWCIYQPVGAFINYLLCFVLLPLLSSLYFQGTTWSWSDKVCCPRHSTNWMCAEGTNQFRRQIERLWSWSQQTSATVQFKAVQGAAETYF